MKKKLALSAVFFALFLALILLVTQADVAAIGPQETAIGLSGLNGAVRNGVGKNQALYKVSKLLGYLALLTAAGFAARGAVQWFRRGSLRKVDQAVWALAALYAVVAVLYVFFEKVVINYRPVLMAGETRPEASFPSTHTMLFCVILGSAALMAGRYLRGQKYCRGIQIVCVALAALGTLCRFLSGVHWFTDILGGLLISAALLLLFSAILDQCEK